MRSLGKPYLVESGVIATRTGFARSTGHAGKYMASLAIVDGTPHLFTAEHLGEKVQIDGGSMCRTEWAVSHPGKSGAMIAVAALPENVRERYRLAGCDYVTVCIRPAEHFKSFPTKAW